jgi:lipopolysaccharide transport system ATP-binding protein
MEGLSRTGRTVIFVSHSMPSVLRLCDRVILLDGGQVAVDGTSAEVVSKYLDTGANSSAERVWPTPDQAPGDHHVRLRAIRILDPDCNVVSETDIRQPTLVEVEYWNMSDEADFRPVCVIHFHNGEGISLFQTHDATGPNWQMFPRGRGLVRLRCRIPGNFLAEGRVLVSVDLSTPSPFQVHAQVEDAAAFHVTDRSSQGDGARGPWSGSFEGAVRPLLEWEQLHLPAD